MIRNGTPIGVYDVTNKEICVGDKVQFGRDGETEFKGVVTYDRKLVGSAADGSRISWMIEQGLSIRIIRRYGPPMFEDALASQSACNLGALVHSLEAIIDHLQAVAWEQSKGTDWINEHPVVRLFVAQLVHLSRGRSYCEAHAICRVHAADYVAKYPASEPPLGDLDYGLIKDPEFQVLKPGVLIGQETS